MTTTTASSTMTIYTSRHALLAPHEEAVFGKRAYVRLLEARADMDAHKQGITLANARTMYDSTNLFALPLSAEMVASYDTGYPQSGAAWGRYAGKPRIHIVQRGGVYDVGDVLDVEPGCAGVWDCRPFIRTRRSQGYFRPTIYCSASWVPAVRQATGSYRLGVDYDLWVADWTGLPHLGYPGAAATQYASTHAYDLSVVYDPDWPHRTGPAPVPVPVPVPSSAGYRQVADGTSSLASFEAKRWNVSRSSPANVNAVQTVAHLTLDHGTPGEALALVNYLVSPGIFGVMPKGLVFYTLNK